MNGHKDFRSRADEAATSSRAGIPPQSLHWATPLMADSAEAWLQLDDHGQIHAVGGAWQSLLTHSIAPPRSLGECLSANANEALRAQLQQAEALIELPLLGQRGLLRWRGKRCLGRWTFCVSRYQEAPPPLATFKQLLDALPFPVIHVGADLRYLFVNRSYEAMYDIARDDILGRDAREVLGPDTAAQQLPIWLRALSGESISMERRLAVIDGKPRDLRLQYVPCLSGEQISGFFVVVGDVTEYRALLRVLQAVHRVVNEPKGSGRHTLQELLRVGREYLQLGVGVISQIDGDDYTVVEVLGGEAMGWQRFDRHKLAHTYCAVTVTERDLISTLASSIDPRYADNPCFGATGLESYIGIPLRRHGKLWGTLCFSGLAKRGQPFGEFENEVMRLLGDAVEHYLTAQERVAELQQQNQAMRELAFRDALTGLRSRTYLDGALQDVLAKELVENEPTVLALLDLDHFKQVNDNYGHDAGDQVLSALGDMLNQAAGHQDIAGRMGGEEFVLLLRHCNPDQANIRLEALRAAIATRRFGGSLEALRISASIGYTTIRIDEDLRSAIRRADEALYLAKNRGRNQLVQAEPPRDAV